ncbi:MAG: RsmB/NOP family class I SAM-dependent RNA methyltransferase [Chlamydiia bacterium]|nr:RsmB/NOP family class I SAM-dependent RNA methyltransferase [Chlamydiia bacterium]
MTLPFRDYHLLKILDLHQEKPTPIDRLLADYFHANRAIGSKDRKEIADTLYGLIRWQGLVDTFCSPPITWEERIKVWRKINPLDYLDDPSIPLHCRVSFPSSLFTLLVDAYGEEKAIAFALASNTQAPITVRANLLKTTREALLATWQKNYPVSATQHSTWGIHYAKKVPFFTFPEFKAGLFEVQDEGSQLLSDLVTPKRKDKVLDWCAGSGGKTLAFAPKLEGTGQIYLHDIRPYILQEAKKRLKRAGIQNAQIILPDSPNLQNIKGKMDWIIVDAPCSGTGTLRRNPDMKWKFTEELLNRLVQQQREIFSEALTYLAPKGKIVFATCSLLPQENQEQMAYFMETHNLKPTSPPFQSLPEEGGMDAFFGVVLEPVR